jgi:hypothetical protein
VIAVVPLPNILVVANYKETQMTNIRIGETASVTVDAFPDLKLTGRVDSWSPGTGSTFALLPPDNATGNFTKVVQRVPVKIVLDPHPALGALVRPGMSDIAKHQKWRGGGRRRGRAGARGAQMTLIAPAPTAPLRLRADTLRPYIGILGVLLGAMMTRSAAASRPLASPICQARGAERLLVWIGK